LRRSTIPLLLGWILLNFRDSTPRRNKSKIFSALFLNLSLSPKRLNTVIYIISKTLMDVYSGILLQGIGVRGVVPFSPHSLPTVGCRIYILMSTFLCLNPLFFDHFKWTNFRKIYFREGKNPTVFVGFIFAFLVVFTIFCLFNAFFFHF